MLNILERMVSVGMCQPLFNNSYNHSEKLLLVINQNKKFSDIAIYD